MRAGIGILWIGAKRCVDQRGHRLDVRRHRPRVHEQFIERCRGGARCETGGAADRAQCLTDEILGSFSPTRSLATSRPTNSSSGDGPIKAMTAQPIAKIIAIEATRAGQRLPDSSRLLAARHRECGRPAVVDEFQECAPQRRNRPGRRTRRRHRALGCEQAFRLQEGMRQHLCQPFRIGPRCAVGPGAHRVEAGPQPLGVDRMSCQRSIDLARARPESADTPAHPIVNCSSPTPRPMRDRIKQRDHEGRAPDRNDREVRCGEQMCKRGKAPFVDIGQTRRPMAARPAHAKKAGTRSAPR